MATAYLQSATDTANASTYTYAGQNLGTAASNRYIIVAFTCRKGSGAYTVTSASIGGVSATILRQENHTSGAGSNIACLFGANVPSGTTGDIVIALDATAVRSGISVYATTDIASLTPYAINGAAPGGSDPTLTLDIPDGGFAIGVSHSGAVTSCTWTGLTEDYDSSVESASTVSSASATGMSAETGRTITADWGATTNTVLVAASWSVSGGGSTTYDDTIAESATGSDSLSGVQAATATVAEAATGADALAAIATQAGAVSEAGTGADAAAAAAIQGGAVSEAASGSDSQAAALAAALTLAEDAAGADAYAVLAVAAAAIAEGGTGGSSFAEGSGPVTYDETLSEAATGASGFAATLGGNASLSEPAAGADGFAVAAVAVPAVAQVAIGADAYATDAGPTTEIPLDTAVRDAIVAALEAAQITVDGVPVTITRARAAAVPEGERPLLNVAAGDEIQAPDTNMTTLHRMRVLLSGYVAATTEEYAERDVSELRARAVRALIRPDPDGIPLPITLADGTTEVWLDQVAFRVEPASVADSEAPLCDCLIDLAAEVRAPLGNPFITV